MSEPVTRMWMPYAQAANQYLGIHRQYLLAAIKAGELPAYEKPRRDVPESSAKKEYHCYFVNLSDVDEYIRTHWQRACQQ